jgi:cytochrome c peroxidase
VILPSIVVCFFLSFSTKISPQPLGGICRDKVLSNISNILNHLEDSKSLILKSNASPFPRKDIKLKYEESRKYYKEIEFFVEYYSTLECKLFINGPLVPKVDIEVSDEAIDLHGFQVLEENLYDESKTNLSVLIEEYDLLIKHFKNLKEYYETIQIEENKLIEAMQLHIIRIMSLTLNGYDCTINKQAISETYFSLNGIKDILNKILNQTSEEKQKKAINNTNRLIEKAQRKVKKCSNSDIFDRLSLITDHLNPIYQSILLYKKTLAISSSDLFYAVNLNEPYFFKENSINKQFFSVYKTDTMGNGQQAALGKLLFYDPILSGNNKRACASCHQADKAFTDGKALALTFDSTHDLSRNSPTLLNAVYQKLFFHDGRVINLESQADEVFNNAFEMQSNANDIVAKLKQSEEYRVLFKMAYKGRADSSITFYAVIKSIAEFIKQLDSRNSRFDQYLLGNKNILTKQEKNGFNLFAGKALCASCHFFPLFNGTVPPFYNDNEFEVLGVPETELSKKIDQDIGREKISRSQTQRYAFKTPTVRNIQLTAPYMHNGSFKTLDSVLTFYNRGGGVGIGIKITNQTLPFDSLGLNKKELADLKKFLLCLIDTSTIPKVPNKLPLFYDLNLNKRKIGGEY